MATIPLYKKRIIWWWKNKIGHNAVLSKDYQRVSELIRDSDEVKDLTDIFNDKQNTIFIDWVHISEEGNSIIAKKISKDVINYLKEK